MTRRGTGVLLVTAALLSSVLVVAAVPAGGAHNSGMAFAAADQVDADTVLLDVSLAPDGDARWELRYRVRLDDDNTTAAFESLERDVEENRSAFEGQFESRIGRTVSAAENATGREMAVRNVTVRTTRQEIPQRYGVLIYGFEWSAFATTDGPRILAGDSIGGLFLDDSTSLTVQWPAGYEVVSMDPEPDDRGTTSATWRGPADFTAEQPRLVISSQAPTTGETDGTEPGADTAGTTLLLGGLTAIAALAVAGWWWFRRRSPGPEAASTDGSTGAGGPPEELLSNEERVLRVLREHGGRMKQQQVVEELGWTDAKTSQVVGELRDSGEIEGFRLGRENVLRLPSEGDEPGP